jgi:hypothetical protein
MSNSVKQNDAAAYKALIDLADHLPMLGSCSSNAIKGYAELWYGAGVETVELPKPDVEPKLHWYIFALFGAASQGATGVATNTIKGFEGKNIGMSDIKYIKKVSNMEDSASLLSVSYLGHMTRSEFWEVGDVE